MIGKVTAKQEQYTEYKLRVPKNLVKRYNVMKLNSPRPIKLGDIKEANMVRKTKKQVYVEEEAASMPTYGAGSVYNYERKEEARKKRRGYITREINLDDLPYALRLGGKGGKRYTGRKEPILEHSAYYILTQCPDGVFEAVPVQAWYNFLPDIDYSTLTSDEVEQEFSKRDRTLSYFTTKYQIGGEEQDEISKVRRKDDDHNLIIHDDEIDEEDQEEENEEENEEETEKKKKKVSKKEKNIFRGKNKKEGNDSDEEEELGNFESKEVDYMSESSSEDELIEMDDEPDPEKEKSGKAKDDLNIFSDSENDDEEESDLNEAGKQLKSMLKKESGIGGSSDEEEEEEEEDEDIDNEFSKSAVFMQGKDGKKKKGKSGSNSGSKPGSRSSTPVQSDQSTDTLSQAAKSLKEGKAGSKRSMDRSSPSPQSKKQKLGSIVTGSRNSPSGSRSATPSDGGSKTGSKRGMDRSSPSPQGKKQKLGSIVTGSRNSPLLTDSRSGSRSGTPSDGGNTITEEAIRRYLTHKPMTTTDLMRKFKLKKTGLSKEQTVNAIGTILKKIQPHQEKIDGKLYLSIKTKR